MLRVRAHGDTFRSRAPQNGQWTTQTVVIWEEVGKRQGVNAGLTESSDFLDRAFGEETGLPQIRTHSQPVDASKVNRLCPVGKEIPGYINRELHSRPMMWNQVGRPPRNVDGRPTYFVTKFADTPKDDQDMRDSNEILAVTNPELFQQMIVRIAERETLNPDDSSRPYEEVAELREREEVGSQGGPGHALTPKKRAYKRKVAH